MAPALWLRWLGSSRASAVSNLLHPKVACAQSSVPPAGRCQCAQPAEPRQPSLAASRSSRLCFRPASDQSQERSSRARRATTPCEAGGLPPPPPPALPYPRADAPRFPLFPPAPACQPPSFVHPFSHRVGLEQARIIPDIVDRVSPASAAELEVLFHGKAIKARLARRACVPASGCWELATIPRWHEPTLHGPRSPAAERPAAQPQGRRRCAQGAPSRVGPGGVAGAGALPGEAARASPPAARSTESATRACPAGAAAAGAHPGRQRGRPVHAAGLRPRPPRCVAALQRHQLQ